MEAPSCSSSNPNKLRCPAHRYGDPLSPLAMSSGSRRMTSFAGSTVPVERRWSIFTISPCCVPTVKSFPTCAENTEDMLDFLSHLARLRYTRKTLSPADGPDGRDDHPHRRGKLQDLQAWHAWDDRLAMGSWFNLDLEVSWVIGLPPVIIHLNGIVHEIKHPAIGVPPFPETSIKLQPNVQNSRGICWVWLAAWGWWSCCHEMSWASKPYGHHEMIFFGCAKKGDPWEMLGSFKFWAPFFQLRLNWRTGRPKKKYISIHMYIYIKIPQLNQIFHDFLWEGCKQPQWS